ncbi:hypothetical protein LUZ63_015551 [Rhynchospora breviuscula]|uniref:F-box domain-containing protein n=1 Tax=Rhynchospora breviuscula TaxID=2022672 RepID=A0A9Q0CCJ0_9POAL|nr:hypothetical protein LUZ63_015551 [Rhynchospora breviuscula]
MEGCCTGKFTRWRRSIIPLLPFSNFPNLPITLSLPISNYQSLSLSLSLSLFDSVSLPFPSSLQSCLSQALFCRVSPKHSSVVSLPSLLLSCFSQALFCRASPKLSSVVSLPSSLPPSAQIPVSLGIMVRFMDNDPSAKSSAEKRKKMADFGTDHLSNLSDEIIIRIFSYLSTKEAFQICLQLSRRYHHIWTLIPVLHFDINEFLPGELQMFSLTQEELYPYEEIFVNFVAYVLQNHAHFTVDAFTLMWKQDEGDPTPAIAWLETVGALWKPKFLSIHILAEDEFQLPDSIFSCESLEELLLDSDGMKPNSVNLPHLKRLTLDNMIIKDEVIQKLLLNLPALELLVLNFCYLDFPIFSSGTLKRLVLNGLYWEWDDANPPDLLIAIPSLLFIKVCSSVMRKLKFQKLESLAEAQIELKQLSTVEPSFLIGISNVTTLELVLTESFLKDALEKSTIKFPTFENLKTLTLGEWNWITTHKCCFKFLASFIFHAPHLKRLTLLHQKKTMSDSNIEITMVLDHNLNIERTSYPGEEKSISEKVIEVVRRVCNIVRERIPRRTLVS